MKPTKEVKAYMKSLANKSNKAQRSKYPTKEAYRKALLERFKSKKVINRSPKQGD